MRIADILATKGSAVMTIGGDATVADAVAALARRSIGALVVSPDGSRIDGVVSERDVVRLLDRKRDPLGDRVRDIMSSPVHTCHPDDQVADIMGLMTNERIRHVPVVTEDGAVCGIVSIGDVVKSTIEQLQLDRKLLEDYIIAR